MKTRFLFLVFVFLIIAYSKIFSQNISEERKLILGTWVAEEGTWTFKFSNTNCKEYIDGKLDATYIFTITKANSYCGRVSGVNLKDTAITFLQLTNISDRKKTCYEINGVSEETLSLWRSGLPESSLFHKKNIFKKPSKSFIKKNI